MKENILLCRCRCCFDPADIPLADSVVYYLGDYGACYADAAPNQRYTTYSGALKEIIRVEGSATLYAGIRATLIGIVPYVATASHTQYGLH